MDAVICTVDTSDVNAESVELCLRAAHDNTMDYQLPMTPTRDVWHMLHICKVWNYFSHVDLRSWYFHWIICKSYSQLSLSDARQLLYVSFMFNDCRTFRIATRALAYRFQGPITEINPTAHVELGLPAVVMSKLCTFNLFESTIKADQLR